VEQLTDCGPVHLMIAVPIPGNGLDLGPLSTPLVYTELDRIRKDNNEGPKSLNAQKVLTSRDKGVSITRPCERCFNDLGLAVQGLMPGASRLRAAMIRLGAFEAWFSGAAATVVGRFENMEQAKMAAAMLVPLMGKGYMTLPVEVKGWKA